MKLLFVEDEPASVAQVKKKVEEEHPDIECEVKGFGEAPEWIAKNSPDIVSLDLVLDDSGDKAIEGQKTYDFIWKERFCPIIVYSAQPELDAEKRADPFVKSIKKGRGSPQKFAAAINELRPHAEAIREVEAKVRREFAVALKVVAPYAFEVFPDAKQRKQRDDAILRCGRRRLAALMDDLARHGVEECLASWEQYLCPPVSDNVQLGDILQAKDGPVGNPGSFSIVLTPSCDLVSSGNRKPKVRNVLVAACRSMKEGLAGVGMPLKIETIRDAVALEDFRNQLKRTILTQGYHQKIIPLPRLEGRIPTMAVDLRALVLIPIEQIGLQGTDYVRIASLDSPFRELVSWAYLQIACRPGLPDRDSDSWCDEIVASCQDRARSTS